MRIILEVGIGEEGLVHRHGGVPFSQSRASPEAFFATLHSIYNWSSPIMDWTCTLCTGNTEV